MNEVYLITNKINGKQYAGVYGFHWMIEEGQSTNCRVGDELPLEAQTIVEATR